jgi:hypothetical protein
VEPLSFQDSREDGQGAESAGAQSAALSASDLAGLGVSGGDWGGAWHGLFHLCDSRFEGEVGQRGVHASAC